MTDVILHHTPDGGEITEDNGTILMGGGASTAVYLSLWGGNEDDPGGSDEALTWWGNLLETDPDRQYRSQTQHLLRSLPAIPLNLPRIKAAVEKDLRPLITTEVFSEVSVVVTIPRQNWVNIKIDTNLGEIAFASPWEATA